MNLIFYLCFYSTLVGIRTKSWSCSMADNVGDGNNRVGIDRKVEALEAAFRRIQKEKHEQMQQIQATLARLVINGDNRRLEAGKLRARGFALLPDVNL